MTQPLRAGSFAFFFLAFQSMLKKAMMITVAGVTTQKRIEFSLPHSRGNETEAKRAMLIRRDRKPPSLLEFLKSPP